MHEGFVNITPDPIFTRLKRLYKRMTSIVKVLGSVLVFG
jgi:hypothetical protein